MRYLYRRIIFYLIALWSSLTINFFLPRLMPGDPVGAFISRFRDVVANNPHILDAIRIELGASKAPLWQQYFEYLGNTARGDFGVSYSQYPTHVSEIIATTLPWTLVLAGSATVLAFVIGTLLGIVASWRRGGVVDSIVTPITMFTYSFPPFFLAMLVLYFLGVVKGWFPLNHAYGDNVQISWNLDFYHQRAGPCGAPRAGVSAVLDRRLAARHAQCDDQYAVGRIRVHGGGEGAQRSAGDAALRRTQRAAAPGHQLRDHRGLHHYRVGPH
jgi:ABC-type dipeptide/oligopeptide/nickel transport system permease component